MRKAIAFTRVSTEKQDEGVRQLEQIKTFCKGKYELLEDSSISEIISGTIKVRDGLTDLMNLTTKDCDVVIVSESSRLSRDASMLTLPITIETIQSRGLDLIILGSNENKLYKANELLNPMDCMYLVFEAYKNREEIATSKRRFKTGKLTKVNAGGFIGHNMPFGYRNNQAKKDYFEVAEEQAEIVRLMFDLVATHGYSANKTSLTLARTHNTKWNTRSVLAMLRNPTYKGEFTIMGVTINVPAIITPEQFNEVQVKLTANHLFISKGTKNFNPLKGLAKCACGCATFIKNNGTIEGKTYYVFQCASKNSAYTQKVPCGNGNIDSNLLNNIVWNATKSLINVEDFKAKTEAQKVLIISESKGIDRQINSLKVEKIELESRVNNTLNSITRTSNPKVQSMMETQLSGLIEETEQLDKKLEQLSKEYIKLQGKLKDLADSLLPSQLSSVTPEERNEIYLKYIKTVTYYSINLNKGFVVINYKNGSESIVMSSSRPTYEAFYLTPLMKIINTPAVTVDRINNSIKAVKTGSIDITTADRNPTTIDVNKPITIPNSYRFNQEDRTIIEIVAGNQIEQTYKEFYTSHNMEDFRLALE